ncbi:hypothetical protein Plhal304r1_c034g0106651 [Plasmopara halstedii]
MCRQCKAFHEAKTSNLATSDKDLIEVQFKTEQSFRHCGTCCYEVWFGQLW